MTVGGLFPCKTRPLTKITSNNSSNLRKNAKSWKILKTIVARKWWKPATTPGRRRSVSLDAKLGELIQTNISNSRVHFRCVLHSCRAATARIVKFYQNFIDALRRDVRGWDILATRYWHKIKCFTISNRHRRHVAPCAAAMPSQSFEGVILRVRTQKIGNLLTRDPGPSNFLSPNS